MRHRLQVETEGLDDLAGSWLSIAALVTERERV